MVRPLKLKFNDARNHAFQRIHIHPNDVSNIIKRQTEYGLYNYGYDDLDRLTQVVPPSVIPNIITPLPIEGYTYDAVHNRKTSSHQTGNLANAWLINANNQLTQWGDASGTNPAQPRVTQTYDANGHLLTKTVTPEDRSQAATTSQRYRYNLAERLIQEANSIQAEIASYSYDPFGRRIRKTVSQASGTSTPLGTTTYLYADEGPLAEADMSGNITATYGWSPNGIWGTAPQWKADVTMASGGTAALTYHYFHNDHLGTSQRLTNDQGVLTWSARMEAFDKTTTIDSIITNLVNGQSQTALMPTTTVNNLRFPGQIEDQETGTFYNWNRDNQATTGRYLQSDPVGLNGGINLYGYVRGNPLSKIDPLGLLTNCETNWIHDNYGYPGGYITDTFNAQQYLPGFSENLKENLQTAAEIVAEKAAGTKGVGVVGDVILSKATSYTAGRVGIGLTVYAGVSSGVLELLGAFLTPFATTTLFMARTKCIDPLDGKRRQ